MNSSTTFKQVNTRYVPSISRPTVCCRSLRMDFSKCGHGHGHTHTHAESSMKKIREGASRTCQRPSILGEEGGREDCQRARLKAERTSNVVETTYYTGKAHALVLPQLLEDARSVVVDQCFRPFSLLFLAPTSKHKARNG